MNEHKGSRALSTFTRLLLSYMEDYVAETGIHDVDLNALAFWAYSKGLVDLPKTDVIKQIARMFQRAARQDYVDDENGEPVRMRHPYRIKQGEEQMVFWFKMDDTTPEK